MHDSKNPVEMIGDMPVVTAVLLEVAGHGLVIHPGSAKEALLPRPAAPILPCRSG